MSKFRIGEVIELVSGGNLLISLGVVKRIKTKYYHITWTYKDGSIASSGPYSIYDTDNNPHIDHYTNSMSDEQERPRLKRNR